MPNIFDYMNWRDISFKKVEFNEIDNLILARLSYFPFDGIISKDEEKFYYDDLKGMFYDNVRLNFTETEGSNFAYMRLNSLEVRMKDKGWYLLPSILTLCYANLMGCPFMGVRSTIDASVSILDCEGKEIKRYEIKEKGSSSGGLYTIGRDVGRFAYIKACKDVLETLNEKIQQDSYEINMALSQAEERVMAMRQQGFAAVNANDAYFSQGLACFSEGD